MDEETIKELKEERDTLKERVKKLNSSIKELEEERNEKIGRGVSIELTLAEYSDERHQVDYDGYGSLSEKLQNKWKAIT